MTGNSWNYRDSQEGRRRWTARVVIVALMILTVGLSALGGAALGRVITGPMERAGPDLLHEGQAPYADVGVEDQWAVRRAWAYGYMAGTGPESFEPDRAPTRGEAAVVLVRCAFGPGYEPGTFAADQHWARPWVQAAVALGLMDGTNAWATIDEPMNRRDLAALLATCGPLEGTPPLEVDE